MKNPCQWKLLQAKYSHKNLEREREREREREYWVLEDRLGVILSRSKMGFARLL